MSRSFTNELHDVAARNAAELGFDVPGLVTEGTSEDTLFNQVTNNAWVGGASVMGAGARVWLMGRALGLSMSGLGTLTTEDMKVVRQVNKSARAWLLVDLRGSHLERRMQVFEMLCGRVKDVSGSQSVLWKLGRRVSLLAYALNRGVIVRSVLPSFEQLGRKWRLRAFNKRSAVCAAMNELRKEMVRTGFLPSGFRFWFEKSADARAVYGLVQQGNQNRVSEAEADEVCARGEKKLSRKELDALWMKYEQRRLERLCGCAGVTLRVDAGADLESGDGESEANDGPD